MKRLPLLGPFLALFFLLGCTQNDQIIDLDHKILQLEKEVQHEKVLRKRLQDYIDHTLEEKGVDFSKGRDGRNPTRYYRSGERADTIVKVLTDPRMDEFEVSLKEALEDFIDKGVNVSRVDNQIYLTVGEKFLFESGKTDLSTAGISNVKKIASLISSQKDLLEIVECHTDNIPVSHLPGIKDNWDLSVLRATRVTRKLIEGGVNPKSILAAGRGPFQPIVANDSDGRRYLNRRTEIILTPAFE